MRDILRELPQIYLSRSAPLTPLEFIEIIKSSYARRSDLKLTEIRKKQIHQFQDLYSSLFYKVVKDFNLSKNQVLLDLTMRSSVINKYDRITGDSISYVVQKVMKQRPRLSALELFYLSQQFTTYQNLDPDHKQRFVEAPQRHRNIMKNLHLIVREFREGL